MSTVTVDDVVDSRPQPSEKGLLTENRARQLTVVLIALVVIGNLLFLFSRDSLPLTGDEAYYWDWSRQLDYNYYSKPPMIALIMRAACWLFGSTTAGVRVPSVLLGGASCGMVWLLTRRLFSSDRLALGATALLCVIPMLVVGSVLMTIDAPLFFFIGLATTFCAIALLEDRPRYFIPCGLSLMLAMLTKYSASIWMLGFFAFILIHPSQRRWLRTPWPYFLLVCIGLSFVPALVWNIQHDWVTFQHLWADVGTGDKAHGGISEILEFVAAQFGLLSPPVAILAICGAWKTLRGKAADPRILRMRFLLCSAAPILLLSAMVGFWNKAQPNWAAAAYFPLAIFAAAYAAEEMRDAKAGKHVRGVVWAAAITGMVVIVYLRNSQCVYSLASLANRTFGTHLQGSRYDLARRARGWTEMGQAVGKHLEQLPAGTFVLASDYQTTALSAFYTPGQPVTYRSGGHVPHPDHLTQYEVWQNRRLDQPELRGRDAIIVASRNGTEVSAYFESIEPLETLHIEFAGQVVRTIYLFHGQGFKGIAFNHAVKAY